MPVPQTYRINPIDLQPNVAVGVSLPFNAPGVFYSTYTTKDQVKYNLINLLLTNKGERIENPNFGSDIKKFVFELIDEENISGLKEMIINSINNYINEIIIENIEINSNIDEHIVEITIFYKMKLSKQSDNLTITFE